MFEKAFINSMKVIGLTFCFFVAYLLFHAFILYIHGGSYLQSSNHDASLHQLVLTRHVSTAFLVSFVSAVILVKLQGMAENQKFIKQQLAQLLDKKNQDSEEPTEE